MQVALHGVMPVRLQAFEGLQRSAVQWSNKLTQAAAVCNELAPGSHSIVGDKVERSLFKAAEARFLVSPACS